MIENFVLLWPTLRLRKKGDGMKGFQIFYFCKLMRKRWRTKIMKTTKKHLTENSLRFPNKFCIYSIWQFEGHLNGPKVPYHFLYYIMCFFKIIFFWWIPLVISSYTYITIRGTMLQPSFFSCNPCFFIGTRRCD